MLIAIGAAFAVVGLLLLAVAAREAQKVRALLQQGLRVQGRVCALENSRTSRGNTCSAPVFEFSDHDDATHRVTSDLASYPPAYRVGDTVTVIYRQGEAASARIHSFQELWLGVTLLATGGGIALIVGTVVALLPASA